MYIIRTCWWNGADNSVEKDAFPFLHTYVVFYYVCTRMYRYMAKAMYLRKIKMSYHLKEREYKSF